MYLEIECPNCFKLTPSKSIDIHTCKATCPYCNHAFSFSADLVSGIRQKQMFQKPETVEVFKVGNVGINLIAVPLPKIYLRVAYSAQFTVLFGTVGCLLILLLLFLWPTMFVYLMPKEIPIFVFGGLLFGLIGFFVAMLYPLPTIEFDLKYNTLKVTYKNYKRQFRKLFFAEPSKEFKKQIEIQVDTIRQLYVENSSLVIDCVHEQIVLNGISVLDRSVPKYIEQELEKFLKIRDVHVKNELKM